MIYETFSASNSCRGFFSFFNELTDLKRHNRVYLIKGGPGTGKSTFLRKLAKKALERGLSIEQIRCSSDPDSLDGVLVLENKISVIDATAPHSYEPQIPGAFDNIIDLGQFWDSEQLAADKEPIAEIMALISSCYKSAYNLLRAAGYIEKEIYGFTQAMLLSDKVNAKIKKFIRQNAITPSSVKDKTTATKRMLSAIGPGKIVTLSDTIDKLCEQLVVFDDSIGISQNILSKLYLYFLKVGYDVIAFYDPLCGEDKIEHLVVKKLRLGFISAAHEFSPDFKTEKVIKTIHTKSMADKEIYTQNKNKISFLKRFKHELVTRAGEHIGKAKELHDDLEEYYKNAMDFAALDNFTDRTIEQLLK